MMYQVIRSRWIGAVMLVLAAAPFQVAASASEGGVEQKEVQKVMKDYVRQQSDDNGLIPILYEGKILMLKVQTSDKYPDGFHSGVQNVGHLFASCTDFSDPKTGDKYDIDFLVNKTGKEYGVVQPVVHSKNGKKNPYDLKHQSG